MKNSFQFVELVIAKILYLNKNINKILFFKINISIFFEKKIGIGKFKCLI